MIVATGGNLRRMGNDQHLNIASQTSQAFADSLSGSTADTCINLIKNHGSDA